jgi:hypothetical protein
MDIKYAETKQLNVHHIYKMSEEDLAKECLSRYQGQKQLFWSEGILFLFEQVSPIMGDEIAADYIKGNEHWHEAYYAELPKYKEYIELEEGDFKGAKVRIVNASAYSPHLEFSKWVKTVKK